MVAEIRDRVTGFFVNGHERTLIAKKNIAFSFVVKAGGILIGLMLVPMTISYVSPVQYGVWLTISSLLGWLSFFDFGLGNGLRNKLTYSLALNETDRARVYVSTTYLVLILISITSFFIFSLVNPYIHWGSILNVTAEQEGDLLIVMWVAVGCFCIQFSVQLVNTILYATHKSANASFALLLGQVFSLIAIYYCTKFYEGSLLLLVSIVASTPFISMLLVSIYLFRNNLRSLAPSIHLVNFNYVSGLFNTGSKFFFLQVGALVMFQTNYIIVSQILGPEQVTTYGICYKLFSIPIMIFTIIMTPLWSSFADAYAKKDFKWLNKCLKKMRKLWLFFAFSTIILLMVSPLLFEMWVGESVVVPWSLSVSMTIYVVTFIWLTLHVYLLNGTGKVRLQLIILTMCALLNIPVAIYLGRVFGLPGIVSANTIFFIIMGVLFSFQCNLIVTETAMNIWDK